MQDIKRVEFRER